MAIFQNKSYLASEKNKIDYLNVKYLKVDMSEEKCCSENLWQRIVCFFKGPEWVEIERRFTNGPDDVTERCNRCNICEKREPKW